MMSFLTLTRLRIRLGLMLAFTLLPWTIWPGATARAEEPIVRDHREPNARIVVVIKRIIVHDDMDWGDGDVDISYQVRTNTEHCNLNAEPGCGRLVVEGAAPEFAATDGSVEQLNRTVPTEGDSLADSSVSPELGIPIRAGQWYGLAITGLEDDEYEDDVMGILVTDITDQDGKIRFGTRTERGNGRCEHGFGNTFCGLDDSAAFSVEYEIREAPLPDLRPIGIKVTDLPGGLKKHVCISVQNAGIRDAGSFEVAFKVDDVEMPDGRTARDGLTSGDVADLCVDTALPAGGPHRLSAAVDEARIVSESNETNNVYVQPNAAFSYSATGPFMGAGPATTTGHGSLSAEPTPGPTVTAPTPTPKPSTAQPDLTVSAIKVNGRVPDGKDDCKDGKNTVTVTVKNGGDADAGKHVLLLAVDGSNVAEEAVSGLKTGQERDVRIEGVRLKKGQHTLTATVDAEKAVAESDEGNNALKVTAGCKDDD
jgi:hypothetical protein